MLNFARMGFVCAMEFLVFVAILTIFFVVCSSVIRHIVIVRCIISLLFKSNV